MPDTIAAIATPQLPSAIGILRLSGPDTRRILDVVFSPAHGGPISGQAPRRMVLGDLHDRQGRIIDSALAVLFPGPHSYTGEDCAEIHCHGSPVVLNEGLDALFAQGARQAKGGEFTQRAFLNGRMDLIQAEAVADLIDAESPAAAHNAVGQLEGRLSRGVGEIYDGLMEVVSRFYAVVDYPDEDIDPLTQGQLAQTLARSETALEALLATFRRGQLLRIVSGFAYTYLGLVLFLCGVNVGFMPAGQYIGTAVASGSRPWLLVPIGMLIGFYIVKAEPAVAVLTKQVEEVSNGSISQRAMGNALSIGVCVSVGLAMVRVLTGLNIMWLLVPGYAVSLGLTFFVPSIFTGIAFDSGGVASGPMTATFLLPFAMGACSAVGGDLMTDAFGIVAMVAMTPLVTIQVMGLSSQVSHRLALRRQRVRLERVEDSVVYFDL